MSLLDQIIDGLHGLFYNKRKSISLGSRFLALGVALITVTSVFPTLAEEVTPNPDVSESAVPEASPSTQAEPSPSPTDASATQSPTPSQSPNADESASPSPSESEDEKIKVAKVQPRISYRFPNSVALDPRATVAFLPQISISGGKVGLLCISSNGLIDVAAKNSVNDAGEGSLLVSGDLSRLLRISGQLGAISNLINSGGGLRVSSSQGRLTNAVVTASYVELTGQDNSEDFCSKATSSRSISFRALGLQMDTVKTRVDFNKPSGK